MMRRWTLGCYLIAVVVATACAATARANAQPSPEEIAQTADRVLEGSAYTLDETGRYQFRILEWIGDRIRDFLRWLDELLGLGEFFSSLSVGMVQFIIGVCVAALIAILVYNGYVLYKLRRMPLESFATLKPARTVTAAELVVEAQRLSTTGNYVDASRRLFLASLILLEEKRGGRVRQGLTNSEYLRSFHSDWVRDNLRVFVDLINWKWYRAQTFEAGDFHRCRSAFETIAARLDEMDV